MPPSPQVVLKVKIPVPSRKNGRCSAKKLSKAEREAARSARAEAKTEDRQHERIERHLRNGIERGQHRLEHLARKSTEGELTEDERAEYAGYVRANKFVAILKRQAQQIANSRHR